jgi:hypothetical protein
MNKLMLIFLALGILVPGEGRSQISFSKVYYDSLQQGISANAFTSTFDNQFIIVGPDGYILKVDSAGNVLWSKKVADADFTCISKTNDSCVIASGTGIYKIANNGNIVWARKFIEKLYIASVWQTFDHGYVVTGRRENSSQPSEIFIGKFNSAGNLDWAKSFTVTNFMNQGASVKQAPDSSYFVCGYAKSSPSFTTSAFLAKLSSSGNIQWVKTYIDANYLQCNDFIVSKGRITLFLTSSNGSLLMRTDTSGNLLWCKNYYRVSPAGKLYKKSDETFLLIGTYFLATADTLGNILWENGYELEVCDAVETKDHGFLVLGVGPLIRVKTHAECPQVGIIKTDSQGLAISCVSFGRNISVTQYSLSGDIHLYPTSSTSVNYTPVNSGVNNVPVVVDSGCVAVLGRVREIHSNTSISAYPNPFSASTTFQLPRALSFGTLTVFDCFGRMVAQRNNIDGQTIIFNRDNLKDGLYYYRIQQDLDLIKEGKLLITNK